MDETSDIIQDKEPVQPAGAAASTLRSVRFSDLLDLFTRPRVFFAANIDLGESKFLIPVVWVLGISAQMDRVDTEIFRSEMGESRALWDLLEPLINGPWHWFWLFCLGLGMLSGAIIYWIGGWWYRVRLRFSGAPEETETAAPRHVYCWSSLVVALPYVLLVIGYTVAYPSYAAAYHSGELVSSVLPLLIFWSVVVSYVGATTRFSLSGWKPRLWFLILPALFYLVLIGAFVFLATLFT